KFYAFPAGAPGTNSRPVYQFVARNPWRYLYALSDIPPGSGWTLDTDPNLVAANGVAFHVFDADVPGALAGFDYTVLSNLLQSGQWKAADEETARIMLESVGRSAEDSFQPGDLEKIPCSVLSRLDQLWLNASQGHFGFSVQRLIWNDALTTTGGDVEAAGTEFGQRIGQFTSTGQLIPYNDLTFNLSAPAGHLPILWWRRSMVLSGFGRPVESLVSRLGICGI
ncbi:MAG TPA: GUN4 domain-containing protein, partial [Allocoleopsis sp.]